MNGPTTSPVVLIAAILAVLLIVFGALLFLSTDDVGTQRLALLISIVSLVMPQLVAMLRGDQAANRLNGELDERVAQAVLRANYVRRVSDVTPESAAPRGRDAIDNPTTTAIPESY